MSNSKQFAAKPQNIGDTFRAITRPVVTIIFAAVIAQVVMEGIDAPSWFIGLAVTVIAFWFGERAGLRIKYHGKVRGEEKKSTLNIER